MRAAPRLALLVLLALPAPAAAEALDLPGWTATTLPSGAVRHESPDGTGKLTLRAHPGWPTRDFALVNVARHLRHALRPYDAERRSFGPVRMEVLVARERPVAMAIMAWRDEDGTIRSAQYVTTDPGGMTTREGKAVATAVMRAAQGVPVADDEPTDEPPRATAPRPPAGPYAQADVERWVFALTYQYGVGGMFFAVYEPVVLMRDGVAMRAEAVAVEDLDPARLSPADVGRWAARGGSYAISWRDGERETIEGDVGPPVPWPADVALEGRYESLGGGGNTAFGGSLITYDLDRLVFARDGTFTSGGSGGAMSRSATVAGTKAARRGTFAIDGSTLTLRFADGTVLRQPLLASEEDGPVRSAREANVIWIGGESWRRK